MKRILVALATVMAVGCGGGLLPDLGGLGDILGSGSPSQNSDLRGTVVEVDTRNRTIQLDVAYINNLRDERRGSVIHYDNETVVEYDRRTYRPEDLERGDEISVVGSNQNGRYVARRITVLRNVRR
jgi:hypothetical protein